MTQRPLNDISSGNPDPARLPDLPRYLGQIAARPACMAMRPSSRGGQWAEAWFAREIAVPFAVNLASGAIDAPERLLCALLLPGDGVVVEDPCFLSSINMVRYAGLPLPGGGGCRRMDPDGWRRYAEHGR